MFFKYNIIEEKTNEKIMLYDAVIIAESIESNYIKEYAKKIKLFTNKKGNTLRNVL